MEQIIENTDIQSTEEDSGEYIRLKVCSKCKIEKPVLDFHKDKSRSDGLNSSCKICKKEYQEDKKEIISIRKKKWREKNIEKIKEKDKIYYEENKEELLRKGKEWRLKNPEKVKENSRKQEATDRCKEYRKKYREENKEKTAKRTKRWRIENREKEKLQKKQYQLVNKDKLAFYRSLYRADKLKATPKWLTQEQLDEIQDFYTACKMFQIYTGLIYHVDHIVPLKGKTVCGLHVPWNLQILEAKENQEKSNKILEEVLDSLYSDKYYTPTDSELLLLENFLDEEEKSCLKVSPDPE